MVEFGCIFCRSKSHFTVEHNTLLYFTLMPAGLLLTLFLGTVLIYEGHISGALLYVFSLAYGFCLYSDSRNGFRNIGRQVGSKWT